MDDVIEGIFFRRRWGQVVDVIKLIFYNLFHLNESVYITKKEFPQVTTNIIF